MMLPTLYDLADALQIELEAEGGIITGGTARVLEFGALKIKAPCAVVAGFTNEAGGVVLVRVAGSLGYCACATDLPSGIELYLLDLTKLPEGGLKIFEARRPMTMRQVKAIIQPAIVATFEREGRRPWRKVLPVA